MQKIKFLIIRFSSFGDIILLLNCLKDWLRLIEQRNIKSTLPLHIEFTLITDPSFCQTVSQLWLTYFPLNGPITLKKWPFRKSAKNGFFSDYKDFYKQLNHFDSFDAVIDDQQDWRSMLITFSLPHLIMLKTNGRWVEKWLLRTFKINCYHWDQVDSHDGDDQRVIKNKNTFGILERFQLDFLSTLFFSPSIDSLFFKKKVNLKPRVGPVLFFPAAAHSLKEWPLIHWKELLNLLDHELKEFPKDLEFQVIWGPQDQHCQEFKIQTLTHRKVTCYPGNLPLLEVAQLISNASLVVTNDSFPAHLAHFFNIETVAFFGPTHESFGFSYESTGSYLLMSDKTLSCRPCSSTGKGICKIKTHACLNEIFPSDVLKAAVQNFGWDLDSDQSKQRIQNKVK